METRLAPQARAQSTDDGVWHRWRNADRSTFSTLRTRKMYAQGELCRMKRTNSLCKRLIHINNSQVDDDFFLLLFEFSERLCAHTKHSCRIVYKYPCVRAACRVAARRCGELCRAPPATVMAPTIFSPFMFLATSGHTYTSCYFQASRRRRLSLSLSLGARQGTP